MRNKRGSKYHHNIEASRDYYGNICTTYGYDERINTINAAKKAGMVVCSGGIIGLGEIMEDRVKLAFQLRDLDVKSIPINVLNPKALIRLAGGRNLIDEFGKNCFNAGVNAIITGNYLTTSGNKIYQMKEYLRKR